MSHHKDPRLSNAASLPVVQDFYERYPYPPPVESLDKYRALWQNPQKKRSDYHLFWPSVPYCENYSILIAGCGTSQAAKHAMRWPSAKVVGIDFSAKSIDETIQLKRKYQLDNLELHQMSVECAAELGTQFDQIVCTGVLHHLASPDAGLKALRSVLKPEGAMQLMLYAPYGRAGIYMLQEFCRRLGITASDEGIDELIAALQLLPPVHPLQNLLREAPDFRNPAALADALLHPQDRAYSVPQLFEFLENSGMTFGRWINQAAYEPTCGVMEKIPQASKLAALSKAEQYAAIELFRGTMLTHSVVAYRNDRPGGSQQPEFNSEKCLGYVPIRRADTICIQERLPPDAAAVLINQSHTFKDLVLLLDAAEKKLFDGIDGNTRIGDIISSKSASSSPIDSSCRFFERLWRWDQIVFDQSKTATGVKADFQTMAQTGSIK
jgi:SAM-dependent methyltransferase